MPTQPRGSTQPRRTSGADRGNMTGRQNEQLRKEQAAEVREAEARMATAGPPVEEDEPTDYTPEGVAEAERQAVVEEDQTEILGSPQGSVRIEAFPRERRSTLQRKGVGDGDPNAPVVVRLNGTYPEVTLGADNHFDFEENRPYRVPLWVAQHLEEKGMLASVGR